MMDHKLISDTLKRRDEQARQGHIGLLITWPGRKIYCLQLQEQ